MTAIEQALRWLDADPARYWTVAAAGFLAAVLAAFLPPDPAGSPARRHVSAVLFASAVVAALAAFRWPVWFYPHDLNPDEAQMVASALTLDQYPVYWKYVDGTTHGPWCEYFLLLAHWLGAPFNYVAARIVGTLLEAGALLSVWGTLRTLAPERVARVAILPGLALWCFTSWDDLVHYSAELPAVFFLAVAGWLGAGMLRANPSRRRHVFAAGIAGACLGSVPFAKLQAVPAALLLAGIIFGLLWRGRLDLPAARRRQLGVAFLAGGGTPAVLVTAFLGVYGLGEHFRASYLLNALEYVRLAEHPLTQMPVHFLHFSATEPAFAWFFWGVLAFALLYARHAPGPKIQRVALAAAWALVGVSLYGVLRPGREVVHYLHLLVIPLTTLAGTALAAASQPAGAAGSTAWGRRTPWLAFVALTLLPQGYNRIFGPWNRFAGNLAGYLAATPSAPAQFIRERARPGDTLAMWGWEPHLLVETGLPHGTREAHTANQIMQWPLQPYYLTRYLWDMERRKPAWFVDVVGPGSFAFTHREEQAHETVPALQQIIATHYEFVAEFQQMRIYRRRPALP